MCSRKSLVFVVVTSASSTVTCSLRRRASHVSPASVARLKVTRIHAARTQTLMRVSRPPPLASASGRASNLLGTFKKRRKNRRVSAHMQTVVLFVLVCSLPYTFCTLVIHMQIRNEPAPNGPQMDGAQSRSKLATFLDRRFFTARACLLMLHSASRATRDSASSVA